MSRIEQRLAALGLVLPAAPRIPPEVTVSFAWVRLRGNRAYIAGHSAQRVDGSPAGPFGKVPSEVAPDAAQLAARMTALSILGSLKRALGSLDRVTAWLMVSGMVNADVGYGQTTNILNGFSELIIDVYGPTAGEHARTAAGVAALPLNNTVVIAAELEIAA